MQGVITKGIGGFYYVATEEGLRECRARGVFRKEGIVPLAGDRVVVRDDFVDEILPRLNYFERPPVANVDTMIIVSAVKSPDPIPGFLDRLTVSALAKGCEVFIVFNKTDIGDKPLLSVLDKIYSPLFKTFFISAESGEDGGLKDALKGRQAALLGPSGAGKSTIYNLLTGDFSETGGISSRTLRGKNTTRHTQLFDCGCYRIFDTPGFTAFDVEGIKPEELASYFPEMARLGGECRFRDCMHLDEPGCAVKEALAAGKIAKNRYNSYKEIIAELKKQSEY